MRAAPLYCAVMGPTLTLTMPRYSSPSISWSCAPGMQGAMRSTSSSTFQASSTGTATRNSSSIFTSAPTPLAGFELLGWVGLVVELSEVLGGVDVDRAAGAVARNLHDVVVAHELAGADVALECPRFGPEATPQEHGVAADAVVGGDRELR